MRVSSMARAKYDDVMSTRKENGATRKKSTASAARKGAAKKGSAAGKPVATGAGPNSDGATDERKRRVVAVLDGLRRLYPDADCALDHEDGLQLLIATILSAQSTDATVNRVTPGLFRRYPTAQAFADADLEELQEAVHATGFFRQKARNVQNACRRIVEEFGGEVPDDLDDLVSLPGVARKTANVILGTWFRRNEGVVVDTHVGRLAHRLDLTWSARNEKDAVKIERDLMQVVPRDDWTFFGHSIILHGRQVCDARKPNCAECGIASHCPSAEAF